LQFENAIYHVISRGNRKENIFLGDRDRWVFLKKADKIFEKYSVICFAYCLMGNHFHLFLRTPLANLSPFMHNLNSAYANWHRTKHGTSGPLFQDRFKSILVERDFYATELASYIHLNPVRAGIVNTPLDSTWSSYRIYHGLMTSPIRNLDSTFILDYFGRTREKARKEYHKFVMEHIHMKNPMMRMPEKLKGSILGSDKFIDLIRSKIESAGRQREVPETRPLPEIALDCAEILSRLSTLFEIRREEFFVRRKNNLFRRLLICILKKNAGCPLKTIGEFLGMDYAAVSMAAKRFEDRVKKDPVARDCFRRAELEMEKLRRELGKKKEGTKADRAEPLSPPRDTPDA
jgi:putative transposase